MPSCEHEGLIEMFRQSPDFAAELLKDNLGLPMPDTWNARVDSADLTDLLPTEFRADAVVTLTDGSAGERPALAVVVEVQLGRDKRKMWSWPAYLANLRSRTHCPVMLLVICPDAAVADECATPIDMGHPGWVLVPLVRGPRQVPVVVDPVDANNAAPMSVLSAAMHQDRPEIDKILRAVVTTLGNIDPDHAIRYSEIMFAVLRTDARNRWEALMTTQSFKFQSAYANRLRAEGRVEGRVEGQAEGEAKAVLRMLDARGIAVPEDVRERIIKCSDLDQLDTWVIRAATANTIENLFA